MKPIVHQRFETFHAQQEEWNRLLAGSVTNVPFLTWQWQRTWWDSFGAGKDLHLLEFGDDHARAIVPLFIQDAVVDLLSPMPAISVERPVPSVTGSPVRTVHLVGGTEVSDYLDILSPSEHIGEVCAATLDYLASRDDWQLIDLHCLPAESPTLRVMQELAMQRNWNVQSAREDVCPVIQLPSRWEEYLTTVLDKKQRHELRRKMRQMGQSGRVDWQWMNDESSLEDGLRVFVDLHRASTPDKQAFMDDRMEGFFRQTARQLAEQNWLRLSVMRLNDQPVATYMCFDYAGSRMVYNSGLDPSVSTAISPGIVLLGFLIDDAIEQGCRCFDFLQGDERYKYEFGARDREVWRVLIRR